MEHIFQFFGRLEWWQRPLVAALPFLLAALVLPALYAALIQAPISVLRGKYAKEDRRQGLAHLGYGAGLLVVSALLTWVSHAVQIEWLGGREHLVAIGGFLLGAYETLYGLGVWFFRTGVLGVLIGMYAFGAFCLYGLLHWTLGWF